MIPAIVSFALVSFLLFFARRGLSESDARTGRRSAIVAALLLLGVFVAGGLFALGHKSVPYNVREMFDTALPFASLALFGAALLFLGGLPMSLAVWWEREPGRFARLVVPLTLLACALAFVLIALAVPAEALDDVVGSPKLRSIALLERGGRFIGLLLGPIACLCLGARVMGGRMAGPATIPGLLAIAGSAVLGWIVVVPLACTDNLTELLRDGGGLAALPGVVGFLLLLGLLAAGIARAVAALRLGPALLSLISIPLSLPLAWALLLAASEPELDKYGKTFSAVQFLLSPSRDNYLSEADLMPRFAVVWVAAAIGIAICMTIARRIR